MNIDIIAVGKIGKSPFSELVDTYLKRMVGSVSVTEIPTSPSAANDKENLMILAAIDKKYGKDSVIIVADERGKNLSGTELAEEIGRYSVNGRSRLIAVIGGADGLNDEIRRRADLILSFGRTTWPHKLVRVMLCEQLYRAQQILAGHPYHRE